MAGLPVKVRIEGLGALRKKMLAAVDALKSELDRALMRGALHVASQAQRNVTAGGTGLHVQTGRLRASIQPAPVRPGVVKVGTNVVYAPIHEFGGKTPAHFILPKKPGGVLRFPGKEGPVFRHIVYHPGSNIPARPYLRPALAKMTPAVIAEIRKVYAGPLNLGGVTRG